MNLNPVLINNDFNTTKSNAITPLKEVFGPIFAYYAKSVIKRLVQWSAFKGSDPSNVIVYSCNHGEFMKIFKRKINFACI